jgi:DNA-binding NarL/FixJ family response regulator
MKRSINNQLDTVRVLIADEQAAFCANLTSLFGSECGLQVVGEAFDPQSIVELSCQAKPDVLLLEYVLFQKIHTSGLKFVSAPPIDIQTLVMAETPEKNIIVDAFRLGARGVVLKNAAAHVWISGVRTVVAGDYWLQSESAAVVVQALREVVMETTNKANCDKYGLTSRELEIVNEIACGRSNKEVGLEFSICERTVKHHLTTIFGKLGVSNRLKLAIFARDNHILPTETISRGMLTGSQQRET